MELQTPKPNTPLGPNKNWFLRHEVLYSVIGVLLVVVVVGSVLWWKEIKKTLPSEMTTCAERKLNEGEKCQDNVLIDQTANWKTYTNTKFGYTVKYQADFVVTNGSQSNSLSFADGVAIGQPETQSIYSIYVIPNNNHITVEQAIDKRIQDLRSINRIIDNLKISDVSVDGINTKKYTYNNAHVVSPANPNTSGVIIVKDNFIYYLELGDQAKSEDIDILLANFKFTTPNPNIDLQIYINNTYGYQLTYDSHSHLEKRSDEDVTLLFNIEGGEGQPPNIKITSDTQAKIENQLKADLSDMTRSTYSSKAIKFEGVPATEISFGMEVGGTLHKILIPRDGKLMVISFESSEEEMARIFKFTDSSSTLDSKIQGIKVGDVIGGMKVVTVKPFTDTLPIGQYNAHIEFEGKNRLVGDFQYFTESFFGDSVCFTVNADVSPLPLQKELQTKGFFCFDNTDDAAKKFNIQPDDKGSASINIGKYTMILCECDAYNKAQLLDVIETN